MSCIVFHTIGWRFGDGGRKVFIIIFSCSGISCVITIIITIIIVLIVTVINVVVIIINVVVVDVVLVGVDYSDRVPGVIVLVGVDYLDHVVIIIIIIIVVRNIIGCVKIIPSIRRRICIGRLGRGLEGDGIVL